MNPWGVERVSKLLFLQLFFTQDKVQINNSYLVMYGGHVCGVSLACLGKSEGDEGGAQNVMGGDPSERGEGEEVGNSR